MKQKIQILLGTILLSSASHADVNVREASYRSSFQDLPRFPLIARHYNSRSLHQGLFGFGWCTEIEKKLDLRGDQTFLQDCEGTHPVNPLRRGRLLEVRDSSKLWIFDSEGELLLVQDGAGHTSRIQRTDKPSRITIRDEKNRKLQLDLDPKAGFVTQIRSSGGDQASFHYEGENLMQTQSNQGSAWKYQYDLLHNLTEVQSKNDGRFRTIEQMTYNASLDQIRSHSAGLCDEEYTYLQESPLEASTLVSRRCSRGKPESIKYHFTFRPQKDGSVSLTEMSVSAGSAETRLSFHPRTGALNTGGLR